MKLLKKDIKLARKPFQKKHVIFAMVLVYVTMSTLKVNVTAVKMVCKKVGLKAILLKQATFVNLPNLLVLQEALK